MTDIDYLMTTDINYLMTTDIDYIKQQLAYAEEQLMLADDMSSQLTWGNRCDALEAALLDLEAA